MATATIAKKPENKEAKLAGQEMQQAEDRPFFLSRMRDEFDRLFHQFTRNWPAFWEFGGNNWRWGVELQEKDDALVVIAEAPGFDANEFDIQVQDHRLVMKAKHKVEKKEKDAQRIEEHESYQSITLPCDIDKDKVQATYRNGVLTVTMPKTAEAKGKKIAVQGA
ncbi:MAG TPA: Hsp20/alpha crystallin family protein [Gemmataceae bacterium]|nr:Hsp20/alpha crystallin family protein [Gemmataceae bacterium]